MVYRIEPVGLSPSTDTNTVINRETGA